MSTTTEKLAAVICSTHKHKLVLQSLQERAGEFVEGESTLAHVCIGKFEAYGVSVMVTWHIKKYEIIIQIDLANVDLSNDCILKQTLYNRLVYAKTQTYGKSETPTENQKGLENWEYFLAWKQMTHIFKTYHFDRYSGLMINSFAPHEGFMHLLKYVKLGGQCSVCYELTRQKTPCGHSLCLYCWEKLKQQKAQDCSNEDCLNEDCNCAQMRCPMCRGGLDH